MSRFYKVTAIFTALIVIFFNAGQVLAFEIIPACALSSNIGSVDKEQECRSISIFVNLIINISAYLFSIVGALALLFFIYGGFTLILSRGATEQVKKGKDIMVAAIIGLVIVFGAYMLVKFLGTAVGLKGNTSTDSGYQLQ